MDSERATLRLRDGKTGQVDAEVHRHGAGRRVGSAIAVMVGALLISAPMYLFPGIHCLLLIPLYGIAAGIAYYLNGRTGAVGAVRGPCPGCGADMTIADGGALTDEALWLRCPHCEVPLEFVVDAEG